MGKIKILVADDHAIVRVGLVTLLGRVPDFEIVGEAGNGAVAVSKALKLAPDVVVLDLVMPKMDGVETLHRMRELQGNLNTSVPVVVLTANAVAGAENDYIRDYDEFVNYRNTI